MAAGSSPFVQRRNAESLGYPHRPRESTNIPAPRAVGGTVFSPDGRLVGRLAKQTEAGS